MWVDCKDGTNCRRRCCLALRTAFPVQVIEMVLATDMKQHFALLSQFNTVHRLAAFKAAEHKVPSPRGSRCAPAAGTMAGVRCVDRWSLRRPPRPRT